MQTRIRLDLFPAKVQDWATGAVVADPCRVVVTDDEVIVFVESGRVTGPTPLVTRRIEDISGSRSSGYRVYVGDGTSFYISRSRNCGCGSTLRGFVPINGGVYIQQQNSPLGDLPPFMR